MMLVIDDNKIKLLRMKEKLLELSVVNREKNLADYEKLALELDKEIFKAYTAKLKDTNYRNLPYDEQLQFLMEVADEYDQINEIQYSLRNFYQQYSTKELALCNLDGILIDNIRDRISNIEGYLINEKRLNENKKDLEQLNNQLIVFEKKNIELQNKFLSMEKDLRYEFLKAEGRKIVDGKTSYTSIIKEYSDNGFDLRYLIENKELLQEKINSALKEKDVLEEKLVAARICYNNVSNVENKDIYDAINKDAALASYKLTLLQMAYLISDDRNTFDEMVEKRKHLLALNDLRIESLNKLGIKFLIDPVSRIKVENQLDIIKNYDTVGEKVIVLRRRIANLATVLESRINSNSDFLVNINAEDEFVRDSLSFSEVSEDVIDKKNIVLDKSENKPVVIKKKNKKTLKNQVVDVKEPKGEFAFARVHEKTASVIKRVSGVFSNSISNELDDVVTSTPKLMISETVQEPEVSFDDTLKEEDIFVDDNNQDIPKEKEPEVIEEKSNKDLDLFEEAIPFEKPALFNDKYDDSLFTICDDTDDRQDNDIFVFSGLSNDAVFNDTSASTANTNNQNVAMPDMFWVTKEEQPKVEDVGLTFDQQVNQLIGGSNMEGARRVR